MLLWLVGDLTVGTNCHHLCLTIFVHHLDLGLDLMRAIFLNFGRSQLFLRVSRVKDGFESNHPVIVHRRCD